MSAVHRPPPSNLESPSPHGGEGQGEGRIEGLVTSYPTIFSMRLDSFLSEVRLIKRRTQAKIACENKIVLLDGMVAKPGKEVKVGQIITINFTNKTLEVGILEIPSRSVKKEEAKNFYRVIREERKKEELL
jgi:ribosomal 50S subunit-recycling heat shock protein